MNQTPCQQEVDKDRKESWKVGHPPFPFLFSEPARPVAPHPGIPDGDNLLGGQRAAEGFFINPKGRSHPPGVLPPTPQPTWFTEWHWQWQAHAVLGLRGISRISLKGNGSWTLRRGQDRQPLSDLLLVSPRGERKVQLSLAMVLLGAATLQPSLPRLLSPKQKGKILHFPHP